MYSRQAWLTNRVNWLCRLFPGKERPRHGHPEAIPADWLPEGSPPAKPFDGGEFWNKIQGNFVGDGTSNTHLDEALRTRVRALPWTTAAIAKLSNMREQRNEHYQPTVEENMDQAGSVAGDGGLKRRLRRKTHDAAGLFPAPAAPAASNKRKPGVHPEDGVPQQPPKKTRRVIPTMLPAKGSPEDGFIDDSEPPLPADKYADVRGDIRRLCGTKLVGEPVTLAKSVLGATESPRDAEPPFDRTCNVEAHAKAEACIATARAKADAILIKATAEADTIRAAAHAMTRLTAVRPAAGGA